MDNKEDGFKGQHKQFSEEEIQKRLYGSTKQKPQQDDFIIDQDLLGEQAAIDISIRQELTNLKRTLASLEEKLKKTEWQKERLKRKLLQRRMFNNMPEKFSEIITGRQPGWMFIILPGIVLLLVLFLLLNQNPKPATDAKATKNTQLAKQKLMGNTLQRETAIMQREKTVPPIADTEGKLYTLQVAEYSNADSAKRFVQNLETQGYLVMVDTTYRNNNMEKPYFKIDVGIFKSTNEAKEFKQEFQRKTGIQDSFIKEKK